MNTVFTHLTMMVLQGAMTVTFSQLLMWTNASTGPRITVVLRHFSTVTALSQHMSQS